MKKFNKLQLSLITRHKTRFFATSIIILIAVGLVFGVGASVYKTTDTINSYYEQNNVSDIIIKSTKPTGISKSDISKIEEKYSKENVSEQFFYEIEESSYRVHALSLENNNINKLDLIEGNMPSNNKEILAERPTQYLQQFLIGQKLNFLGNEYTISGIVNNPYYFQKEEEPMFINVEKSLKGIFYMNKTNFLPTNDIYVKCSYRNIDRLSKEYLKHVEQEKTWVLSNISDVNVLSLEECVSFTKLYQTSEKVQIIAWFILIVFILAAGLVILTIVSRLVEEQRAKVATLKTLGYSNSKIARLFFIFSILASLIGIGLSWPFGYGLSELIFVNFRQIYSFPNISVSYNNTFYLVASALILLTAIGTSLLASHNSLKENPAMMLQRKAPKAGKQILLEKISFIWKRLSFKKKCTAKNIFRNKKNLIMTLFSIIGTSVLVMLGFGLLSYSFNDSSKGITLRAICLVILLCALLLTAVIVYVLTNINISERKREIATFMVLGYHDREVEQYVFNEVYIITTVSTIIGTPIGVLLLYVVFQLLAFGGLHLVDWWSYVVSPLSVLLFTFITTLCLKKKIVQIDMNDSLKSLE